VKHALTAMLLTILLAAGTLWAGEAVNEHRNVASDALIELNLIAGTVKVTGWQKSEMELTGTLGDDRQKLEITGGKDRLKIEVDFEDEGEHHNVEGSDLELRVPRGARVRIETVSAPITVSDLTERIDLNSVSGKLEVQGSPKEAKLNTVSGAIVVDDGAALENLDTNTVSGDIEAHLRLRSGGSFSFNTVSGGIELRLPANVSADFEASTFSGSIHSDFGGKPEKGSSVLPAQSLDFTLGSGGARVKINSFSGPIKIRKE
jgi:DUF4097 and DUF4098 domain-containing protein YvlB